MQLPDGGPAAQHVYRARLSRRCGIDVYIAVLYNCGVSSVVSTSNLMLNFAPVTLSGETTLHVGYRPFEKGTLNDLRAEFAQTLVFKRDGKDNRFIEIPVAASAELLSDKSMEVNLKENWWYWAPLMNAALVRAFDGKREIACDYPVEVLGSAKLNYIRHEKLPEWVQKRSLLHFTP